MPNRLAGASSPYLLQHAENPVDWYPWGEEAFAKARAENKPVFLSVGYSSCHWCHVMAHESFEDETVAEILNGYFVSIKVDREERPDVDEAYMTAVQLTSGRGGWPMSVFLTPDRRPFFAGTYFPKEDRGQFPGFASLLAQLARAWQTRRAEIEKGADEITAAVRKALAATPPATTQPIGAEFIWQAVANVLSDFDEQNGGFGTAPKFPPHSAIELLFAVVMHEEAPDDLREASLRAGVFTLRQMVFGGIRDHVGGGFHRYSTDAEWRLPHFEKMLYDNALILGNLSRGAALAEAFDPALSAQLSEAAFELISWLEREMAAPEGYYYSALDADTEGEEGRFYVWSVDEVRAVLGARADAFLAAYGFQDEGNFLDEATQERTGLNIPIRSDAGGTSFAEEILMLQGVREARVRPGRDEKGLVGWNGLAIGALAEAGAIGLAARVAGALLRAEAQHGRLPHQISGGVPSGEAFLEDYAAVVDGLLKVGSLLQGVEGAEEASQTLLQHGARLAIEMRRRFYDAENGGFFGTGEDHEELFGRTKPVFDHPIPSSNALAIRALLMIGDIERARQSLLTVGGWIERAPGSTEALLLTALLGLEVLAETPVVLDAAPAVEIPAPAPKPTGEVLVKLLGSELRADSNRVGHGTIRITIPEGLHVNSPEPPARWLTPTRVEIRGVKGKALYPPAENDRYEGEIEIPFTVELPAGKSDAEFEVRVGFQACTESECQLAVERTFGAVVLG